MRDVTDDGCQEKTTKCIVVNCVNTRYHVVRAATISLGWYVEDEECENIPPAFHGLALKRDMQAVFERLSSRGMKYDPTNTPQILWLDKSVLSSRVSALSCHHRINHFPGIHIIARKAVLFKRLMRIRRKNDLSLPLVDALKAFPWSFSTTTEMLQLERLISSQNQQERHQIDANSYFILKPGKGCQGKGIVVTPEPLQALERIKKNSSDDWLVQLYVTPPLCIDRKKFDLRIYVLITSVVMGQPPKRGFRSVMNAKKSNMLRNLLEGLQVFVHDEGLVRICAEEYSSPNKTNCDQSSIHLTNYAVNKGLEGFSVGQKTDNDIVGICEGNKRDFRFLKNYINSLSHKYLECDEVNKNSGTSTLWEYVLRRIDMCIMLTILSGWEELQREFIGTGASRGLRSDARNCFELLGFDLMLTAGLDPVLMEVNHSPSLFCDTEFDFETKHRVVMDVLRLLEPYVPSIENCDDASYAAYQAMASVKRSVETGFRQISPQRTTDAIWGEEEMCVFEEMLRHARQR
ncbi:Tubulin-tyrosine ligase/Tubulin polyglutamylase [Trypanosoma melophagium]|uniref:Tubulin-tyrosine ligase/Tubulin polyglutamylase n=1 Tax=Trypanosoma melophagium TaxID=715481 RepID=UPI00351A634D|nr:Tubulin-tyrosine ligase/Tubulin polyglutamylase [Trypanosoma melophagium]